MSDAIQHTVMEIRGGNVSGRNLPNKPLIEVIMEVRWQLQKRDDGLTVDPHYQFLLGRFYEKVVGEYPAHEQLPIAEVPDGMVPYNAQHRFRMTDGGWPLVQLGPGILTINETKGYDWEPFSERAVAAVDHLFNAHPKTDQLVVNNLLLRFIDGIEFDYKGGNAHHFLRDKLKIVSSLPEEMFGPYGIDPKPQVFNWNSAFISSEPKGLVSIKLGTGVKDEKPAIILETVLQSKDKHVPDMPGDFKSWADAAHKILVDWFFELIEGDLRKEYENG